MVGDTEDRAFISRRRLACNLLLLEVVAVQAVHDDCPFRNNILLCIVLCATKLVIKLVSLCSNVVTCMNVGH